MTNDFLEQLKDKNSAIKIMDEKNFPMKDN